MKENSKFYYGKLPHWQPAEATFFITMRLAGSIPKHIINQIKEQKKIEERAIREEFKENIELINAKLYDLEKKYFAIYDKQLDNANAPYWLKESEIAKIVAESIHFFEKEDKQLINYAYCIMPNHVHWVLKLNKDADVLYKILQRMKRYTARQANKILNRKGQFWEEESYDHIVRDTKEFDNIVWYTLQNPVKAGFVKKWEDWEFSYVQEDFWK
jgi:REP element-mobilizing transposase RayT